MRHLGRVAASAVAATTLVAGVVGAAPMLAASATGASADVEAAAKQQVVKGKLAGGRGMTVVALHADGVATTKSVTKASGAFKLRTDPGSSLHVIGPDGNYYGPVVLAGNKKKLKKSTRTYSYANPSRAKKLNTGTLTMKGGRASVTDKVASTLKKKKYVQRGSAYAVATKGKPVGAGKYGFVLMDVGGSEVSSAATQDPSLDTDKDGLPNAFDVDNNGNEKLDNVDYQDPTAAVGVSLATKGFWLFSNYKATAPDFSDVINVNVATPTSAQLDASVNAKTGLAVEVVSPGAQLWCTGQVYCPATPMTITAGPTGDFQWHLASTYPSLAAGDAGAGDTFVERAGGRIYPGVLNFVFLTTPALKSYSILDSSGATLSTTTVDWTAGNKAGSQTNPIPVSVSTGEQVKLEFWRPQRPAIGAEPNTDGYVDIGGLIYLADDHPGFCAATNGDSDGMTIPDGGSTAVRDLTSNGVPSATRTLSMIVDLSTCVNSDIDIQAKSDYGDNAAQKVFFTRS
ncbi:MAG: hypothetical protein KDC39_05835 [Actinobacteria bacterium]|nr:hypothetical protein [Actinomycetota bacterium]